MKTTSRKYKMHRCAFCGRTHRVYQHPTHGNSYYGSCECGHSATTLNAGKTYHTA